MKIIDLLNKIANGEEVPKKISWKDIIFIYADEFWGYMKENYLNAKDDEVISFMGKIVSMEELNDEVTILDIEYLNNELGEKLLEPFYRDNKIKKLKHQIKLGDIHEILISINIVAKKVNELIDEVNKLKEKK